MFTGGTIDIAVHQLQDDGRIVELHAPSGGYWGGHCINKAFLALLADIVGAELLDKWKEENVICYIELMDNFEAAKRLWKEGEHLRVTLPYSLVQVRKHLKMHKN